MSVTNLAEAKASAKALRAALAAEGRTVSHSEALELVARQAGARDWNTLCARLAQAGPEPWKMHQPVQGLYLGQRFRGRIVAVSQLGAGFKVSIALDRPVDTVTFASFSNLRRRISGVVGADGRSPRRTSDGRPQLVVEPLSRRP